MKQRCLKVEQHFSCKCGTNWTVHHQNIPPETMQHECPGCHAQMTMVYSHDWFGEMIDLCIERIIDQQSREEHRA